jgi:hypothetical protein
VVGVVIVSIVKIVRMWYKEMYLDLRKILTSI